MRIEKIIGDELYILDSSLPVNDDETLLVIPIDGKDVRFKIVEVKKITHGKTIK
jgi:hypothetical protein